jgi:hypothetical protein
MTYPNNSFNNIALTHADISNVLSGNTNVFNHNDKNPSHILPTHNTHLLCFIGCQLSDETQSMFAASYTRLIARYTVCVFFCVSKLNLRMTDLDGRKILQRVIKVYFTRSM